MTTTVNGTRERFAPIAVFAYKRPEHLRKALASLAENAEAKSSRLYLFCDGAKGDKDRAGVEAVRQVVKSIGGYRSVTTVFSESNQGLAKSIISGVERVLRENDRVIVLEDDLVVSPHFLAYMNDGLRCYADDPQVASIHGYIYPVDADLPPTFFLRGADCWGWATWRRAWQHFNPNGQHLLNRIRESGLEHEFDLDGSHGYTKMLEDQVRGINDSWAIRWHASCFLKAMLTLYPGESLVTNIGTDGTGTHCESTDSFTTVPSTTPVPVNRIPVSESKIGRDAFIRFFRGRRKSPFIRLAQRISRYLDPNR